MSKVNAAITAVGGYLPDYVMTNAELETLVDTNDEWIRTRTGIIERRILKGEGVGTSVMGVEVVRQLLEKSGTSPEEVDALICATVTPDFIFPGAANLICGEVGLTNAFCFDLNAVCSGFVHAIVTGSQFIQSGTYKKVIVMGADKMSALLDYSDRTNCILFGDGAAGVLLEPNTEGFGIQDAVLKQDIVGKEMIMVKGGGSAYPASHETVDNRWHYFKQNGRAVFKHAVRGMSSVTKEVMERNGLKGEDIRYLMPHQANKRILQATAREMGISMDKVTINIEKYGNTTAATVPLCLWEWERKLKKGDNLILAAFGAGFNYGAVYLKWAY